MTHKEFITEMALRNDMTQTEVSDLVDVVVDVMGGKLAENSQISILNFGLFETKKRSERISVNPQTRQRYLVPPAIAATFKPAAAIKDELKKRENDGE